MYTKKTLKKSRKNHKKKTFKKKKNKYKIQKRTSEFQRE